MSIRKVQMFLDYKHHLKFRYYEKLNFDRKILFQIVISFSEDKNDQKEVVSNHLILELNDRNYRWTRFAIFRNAHTWRSRDHNAKNSLHWQHLVKTYPASVRRIANRCKCHADMYVPLLNATRRWAKSSWDRYPAEIRAFYRKSKNDFLVFEYVSERWHQKH